MLVGMGTVLVFLTILVLGMTIMSAIAMKFSGKVSADDVDEEEIAAITAAIVQHRTKTTNS